MSFTIRARSFIGKDGMKRFIIYAHPDKGSGNPAYVLESVLDEPTESEALDGLIEHGFRPEDAAKLLTDAIPL